jgi:hypothetical protein
MSSVLGVILVRPMPISMPLLAPVTRVDLFANHRIAPLWHAVCSFTQMSMFSDSEQALFFLLISAALGACFIWAFWELEQAGQRRRLQRKKAKLSLTGKKR